MALGEYKYLDLDSAIDEIRLLKLEPGSGDDTIRCWIEHVAVGSTYDYTALSYTWGSGIKPDSITINNSYNLNITANLKDALHQFRHETKSRKLWIDAVCIDQKNIAERNAHLSRMRDIYAQASHVEVWLGKADDTDHRALSLIQQVGQLISDPEYFLSKGGIVKHRADFENVFDNCPSEVVKALNGLFKRPWWTRVWVVQELSIADQSAAKVTCGNTTVSWLDFLLSAYAIEACWGILNDLLWSSYPDDALDGFNNGIRMAQCRHVQKSQPRHHLLELLHQHRDCEATDPRDHVYGLLGLSGDAHDIGVEPDYNKPVQEIYKDLAIRHIRTTKSLDMICAARGERNLVDLPSWVPDWSSDQVIPGICINERYCGGDTFPDSPSSHVQKYKASNTLCANISLSSEATELTTKALKVGKVVEMSPVDDGLTFEDVESFGKSGPDGKSDSGSETFDQWLNLILDDENCLKIKQIYGDEILDAFSRCLVANRNNRMMIPPRQGDEQSSDQDSSEVHSESMNDSDKETEENRESNSFASEGESEDNSAQIFSPISVLNMSVAEFKATIQVSWGKKLAILDTGFLGIVPGHCEVEDFAYVIPGSSLPVILRNESKNKSQDSHGGSKNSLIGESYFHGICEGELMDGREWKDTDMEMVTLI